MGMLRSIAIMVVCSLLGSCATTTTNNTLAGSIQTPPYLSDFQRQYKNPRDAIEAYHVAVNNYIGHLLNHQRKLEVTYNLSPDSVGSLCTHRSVKLPTIPDVPDMAGLSDEQVVDTLIEHIKLLRAKLAYTSERNANHNEDMAAAIEGCRIFKY